MDIPLNSRISGPLAGAYVKLVRTAACIMVIAGLLGATAAVADSNYTEEHLRGDWVWSGLMKFGAPVPIPANLIDGAPPHAAVAPGEVVGIWASLVGLITFDGEGNVTAEDMVKAGEIVPAPGLPFEALPPFPEVYTGSYTVSDKGTVDIFLEGRDPSSPEGQVDFEFDLHCVLNRWPREMTCLTARFKTFFVDPNGFAAPITGIIDIKRRY